MSRPILHYHPLSSYCHKVLIAIDVLGAEVELRPMDPSDPAARAAFAALWPTAKIPLLVDGGRPVPESSIMIEHLQRHHARSGSVLIPDEPEAALAVRLWDRLSDQYLMGSMQGFTNDRLRPPEQRDPIALEQARQGLQMAYGLFERQLAGRRWLTGEAFTMADCAAAPALFYALAYLPLPPGHEQLAAYFDRLMDHPPVQRTVDQARPWLRYFPGREGLARRFHDPDAGGAR